MLRESTTGMSSFVLWGRDHYTMAGGVLVAGRLGAVLGLHSLDRKGTANSPVGVTAVTDLSGCPVTSDYLEKGPRLYTESCQIFISMAT